MIWLAYLAIPLLLAYFSWRKRALPFHGLFLMFCAFILSCGFSHLLDAVMFHVPVYRLFGFVKLITAIVSWTTVVAMIPVIPRALDLAWDQTLQLSDVSKLSLAPSRPAIQAPNFARRYAVALASAIAALVIQSLLEPLLGRQMLFLPLIVAVVVSSWFGGFGPGLVATAFGILAGFIFQRIPLEQGALGSLAGYATVGLFTLAALAVLLISESQRSAQRRVFQFVGELTAKSDSLEREIARRQRVENALCAREQELERQARDLEEVRRQTAESLAILDAFVKNAPIGMFFLDKDRKPLFKNQVLDELIADAEPEPSAMIRRSRVPALASEIESTYHQVQTSNEAVLGRIVHESMTSAPADRRTWSIGLFPVRVESEEALGVGGVVQEITELMHAQELIRESESRFRLLAESLPQLVWATLSDGSASYFNQRWYDYTGMTQAASIGKGWTDAIHPQDQDKTHQAWSQAVQTQAPYEVEYRIRRGDGTYRWFLGRGRPWRDDAGEVQIWFGTCTDIEDLKQIQVALHESQERFSVLAESLPLIVWTAKPSGEIDYLNRCWFEYTGHTSLETSDTTKVMHPDDLELTFKSWEQAQRDGQPFQKEMRLKRGYDGTYRWHLVRSVPLRDSEGNITQWVGSSTDVDDQHRQAVVLENLVAERTAELVRSNKELEQFASVASHDLQEPLRKIQSFGDRLKTTSADQLGDRGQEYLERILSSTTRLRRLIDDLLQFSRVTTSARPFQQVDLNQILQEVVSDLESLLQKNDGRVLIHKLPKIRADASQMRQLFLNLIGNALKFHRPGQPPSVEVLSRTIQDSENPEWTGTPVLEIRVEDNGIGFENQYSERIFKLFERLHGRGEFEGTGMGLAICRKIVERHGGTIRAEGRPNQGAMMILQIPFLDPPPPTGAEEGIP